MQKLTRLGLAIALASATAIPTTAQTIDRIKETGEIRLGVRADAAPLSYTDADGNPAGYAVKICSDLAVDLATALELESITPVFVTVTPEERFDAVASGEIDLLCGAASVTLERRKAVDFSTPIFIDGAAVMIPRGANPEFSALAGKRIGVRSGTTTEVILNNTLTASGMEAELAPFENHGEAMAALEASEIDAYFGDQSILFGLLFASDMMEKFAVSDNTLTVEKQALAMLRGDTDFRLAVDQVISDYYRSGAMTKNFEDNFPGATPGMGLEALFIVAPDMP